MDRPKAKPFKAYAPGFVHIDVKNLPQMADETKRRYLFVAIDRATRWVFVRVYASKTSANTQRFNGRIADILRTHPFRFGEAIKATILRYVWLYNHHLPQKTLGHVRPIQALKQWQQTHPELFKKRVTNYPGHDT